MFNSLKYAKNLEEAGVPRNQAEAHVLLISELLEMNLATKHDIALLEQKLIQLEQRMTIRLGTMMSAAIGVAVALSKLFT